MSKFAGNIGFSVTAETAPGVWEETITEKRYYGDVTRNHRKTQDGQGVNDNITFSNQISILADPYIYKNIGYIRYIELWGSKWKVNDVEINYPRLTLNVGGLYND